MFLNDHYQLLQVITNIWSYQDLFMEDIRINEKFLSINFVEKDKGYTHVISFNCNAENNTITVTLNGGTIKRVYYEGDEIKQFFNLERLVEAYWLIEA